MKLGYAFRMALLAAAATLLGVSCSDDPVTDESEGTGQQPGPEVPDPGPGDDDEKDKGVETLTVTLPADGAFGTLWPEGARIAAVTEQGIRYYNLTEGAASGTGTFALEDDDEAPAAPFTVRYPAEEQAIPSAQNYTEAGVDPAALAFSALAEDPEGESLETGTLDVTLRPDFAIIGLQLKGNVTVASVTITGAETALAGESRSVTLDAGDGIALDAAAARDFRMAVLPGEQALSIRIRSSDGRTKTEKTETLAFDAGTEQTIELEVTAAQAEFTSAPYAVGDYYFDGEAEGVVVEVDRTGSQGKIIAMRDAAETLAWGFGDEVTGAQDTEYGPTNMATIAALDAAYDNYPAFKACAGQGEGWYLPAQHEMQAVRKILDAVNATLGWRGGEEIAAESVYWSSSEADEFSDAMAFAADMEMPGMFGIQKTQLLRVRAFREFGELPETKFKVGTLYEADGRKGIIFWASKDDTYAKIVALDDADAEWGAVGTAAGADDEYDGEKNMKAVRSADASLDAYPAFKACADRGEGWYLPSLNEAASLSRMYAALNAQLTAAGGEALDAGYHWTSTELNSDAANSAQCIQMNGGALLASSKNIARKVRAVAYVGDRPVEARKYQVGDAYEIDDQVLGIVCATTDDGVHGTIIALKNAVEKGRINAIWDHRAESDNYILLGLTDTDDGRANAAKAQESDPLWSDMSAFGVCAALGDGWYLGAVNEMKALYDNKSLLDAALKAAGGTALDNDDYWTSTEGTADPTQRAVSVSLKNGSTFDYRKYMYLRVRPMKRF